MKDLACQTILDSFFSSKSTFMYQFEKFKRCLAEMQKGKYLNIKLKENYID